MSPFNLVHRALIRDLFQQVASLIFLLPHPSPLPTSQSLGLLARMVFVGPRVMCVLFAFAFGLFPFSIPFCVNEYFISLGQLIVCFFLHHGYHDIMHRRQAPLYFLHWVKFGVKVSSACLVRLTACRQWEGRFCIIICLVRYMVIPATDHIRQTEKVSITQA